MEGTYFQNPTFPNNYDFEEENNYPINTNYNLSKDNVEQSYIENILRANKGKKAKIFVSYPDSSSWQNKVYEGIIEQAGKDHLILRDFKNQTWYLIRLIYLDYVEFDEKVNYNILPIKN